MLNKNKENDMLDLNKLFLDFHDEILLTKTYKEKITKNGNFVNKN